MSAIETNLQLSNIYYISYVMRIEISYKFPTCSVISFNISLQNKNIYGFLGRSRV